MRPLVLLAGLVALAGCREAIVDAPLDPLPAAPTVQPAPLYIKGVGDEMVVLDRAYLRAEPLPTAVSYVWDAVGEAQVEMQESPSWRTPVLRPITPGTLTLRVLAYDADGAIVGRGTRSLFVRRPS